MLDEIPSVKKSEIIIKDYSKIVCYTDGLSELKYKDGKDIGTTEIISHISNTDPVEANMREMIKDLGYRIIILQLLMMFRLLRRIL